MLSAVLVFVLYSSIHERVVGVGDSAPDFTITADNGRTITTSKFWRTFAGFEFLGHLVPALRGGGALARSVRARDGRVRRGGSGRQRGQEPQAYREFLSRSHVSFMTARDPDAKISADYGTFKYPESYIIDSKGKVVQKIIGATNWTDGSMVNAVKSFL